MANGPSWTAEYDPERPQRSAGHPRAAGAVCAGRRGDRMRRREIAAYVWVHPPSRRTTVRIAEGGRKKLHQLYRCSQFYSEWRAVSRAKQSTSAPRLSRRLGGYRARSAGRVSVMGRNAPDALGQQIVTGRRMADVTQTDDPAHPLSLVHHRQPAELQLLHVMHRLCEVIVLPATMDAFGHHIARHRAASIEVVARKPFADDVAVGDHPDQSVVFPDRNAADVMLPHQFREFGDRGVGADPVDTLVHHVFDFHGGPPLLEFQVHLMQCSSAPRFLNYTPARVRRHQVLQVAEKRSFLRDRST